MSKIGNSLPPGGYASDLSRLPEKPELKGTGKDGKVTEDDRLKYQEASQAYWFAVNAQQNQQNQEGTAESNMQKAAHDAMMAMTQNLK